MPQGALPITIETYQGGLSRLNLTAAGGAQVVKASAGRVMQINVNVASTGAIAVYDSSTTAGTSASNLVYQTPAVVAVGSVLVVDFPVANGIVVVPGTSSTVAVSYL